ncbi:MAG: D-alanine--D-alanine ligase [Treponema sp.]|jgi:D-alanine-D-alanine ligase|nr:D-alanine--D-alanine ligase [Treponema sp.]
MIPNGRKIKVGILFGGKSAEHEVSLQSARNVYEAIDRGRFEPVLIGIDKSGKWRSSGDSLSLLNASDPRNISLTAAGDPVALIPESQGLLIPHSPFPDPRSPFPTPHSPFPIPHSPLPKLDVVFPILHGPFGEDGTVQGLLRLADIPFAGSGVLGSAVGMDKDVMKRLLRDAGIPIGKFIALGSHEPLPSFAEIEAKLGSPVFIKPANMGSSVGISKVHGESEFSAALSAAFQYDAKIVIEEHINCREIECAVLGNENPAASIPGEVIPTHEFYSYDAKYLDENGAKLEIPARLDGGCQKRIQELAVQVFQTLCCDGLARVDFFLGAGGDIFVNEINTMPGFTKISMYPKLWEASGIGYTELISRLIELAIEKHEKGKAVKIAYG